MAQCLSNLSISSPIPSQTVLFSPNPNPLQPRLGIPVISGKNWAVSGLRTMAVDGRGNPNHNLDPLQRPVKQAAQKRPAQVAPIGLWDRFPSARTINQMMDTMEKIMDDPYAYTTERPSQTRARGRTPWEIKELETEYKIRFDMPGMTKRDVKVWVEEQMLVFKAEKKSEGEEENGEGWPAKSYGRYSRRIALPENVEFEKIKAEVKDGVLYITIPKSSSKAKVFDVNVE